jgi:hypothetical protein
VCELDLEGIVAKHRFGPYVSGDAVLRNLRNLSPSTWFKIRNPHYSQWAGRHEALERDRHREPVPDGIPANWRAVPIMVSSWTIMTDNSSVLIKRRDYSDNV